MIGIVLLLLVLFSLTYMIFPATNIRCHHREKWSQTLVANVSWNRPRTYASGIRLPDDIQLVYNVQITHDGVILHETVETSETNIQNVPISQPVTTGDVLTATVRVKIPSEAFDRGVSLDTAVINDHITIDIDNVKLTVSSVQFGDTCNACPTRDDVEKPFCLNIWGDEHVIQTGGKVDAHGFTAGKWFKLQGSTVSKKFGDDGAIDVFGSYEQCQRTLESECCTVYQEGDM